MKTFIIQIQLHEASPRDYSLFHTAMKKEAFQPVKGKASSTRLSYQCHDRNSITEVINDVLHVRAKTGNKISFTVMKDKSISKQGVRGKQEQYQ
jgi:hypothetical protein